MSRSLSLLALHLISENWGWVSNTWNFGPYYCPSSFTPFLNLRIKGGQCDIQQNTPPRNFRIILLAKLCLHLHQLSDQSLGPLVPLFKNTYTKILVNILDMLEEKGFPLLCCAWVYYSKCWHPFLHHLEMTRNYSPTGLLSFLGRPSRTHWPISIIFGSVSGL